MTFSAERMRWCAAWLGGVLWIVVSTFPLLGGAAKHRVRCRGTVFTGRFDDCYNDLLPIFEILAPLAGLALLWPFLRMGFSFWAPQAERRRLRWRMASRSGVSPLLHYAGLIGALGCLWRAALYPIDVLTWPFQAVWILFALWFGSGGWLAYQRWRDY